jgi:hypothetical protein
MATTKSVSILIAVTLVLISCSETTSGVATVVATGEVESVLGYKSQGVEISNGTANHFDSAAIGCRMNDGSLWTGAVSDVRSGAKSKSMVMAPEKSSRASRAVSCGFRSVFTAEGPTMDSPPGEIVEQVENLR